MSKSMKYFLWIFGTLSVLWLFVSLPFWLPEQKTFSFYFIHTYTSSPGFVVYEDAVNFEKNKKVCKGINILLNRDARYADAPGVSLCIGLLSSTESDISNVETLPKLQENNVPAASDPSGEFAGKWVSMGNDVLYIELDLNQGGFFTEYVSSVNTGESKNLTGRWESKEESGVKYLIMIYDENIFVPQDKDQIEIYKEYGEEFVGNNQRISKINPYSSLPNTFRVDGVLMERNN